ncbi:hypothetical protein B0A50_08664 [Salinomyces thailandicus]|uniref:Uncharacterized protein n=1 Tax=Salinomyces thailandicus TaxID=706561 RepID=A0A4U0TIU3_9PEZI|nr:hypothetical protein B0A50_08664 [Salinomyces thailandica]
MASANTSATTSSLPALRHVDYVGSVFHGTLAHNACEAFRGNTIQSVSNKALEHGVYTKFRPNVHVGTKDRERAGAEVNAMADKAAMDGPVDSEEGSSCLCGGVDFGAEFRGEG